MTDCRIHTLAQCAHSLTGSALVALGGKEVRHVVHGPDIIG